MENLQEAKVYVGTYAKYNDGSIKGAWLNIADYYDKDEFLEACKELHEDESDNSRELMFQDWENIPDGYIGESWISDKLFEAVRATENLDADELEAFYAYLENFGGSIDENAVDDFRERYYGDYSDHMRPLVAFAEDNALTYLGLECSEDIDKFAGFLDYEAIARDMQLSGCYTEFNGYIFSR